MRRRSAFAKSVTYNTVPFEWTDDTTPAPQQEQQIDEDNQQEDCSLSQTTQQRIEYGKQVCARLEDMDEVIRELLETRVAMHGAETERAARVLLASTRAMIHELKREEHRLRTAEHPVSVLLQKVPGQLASKADDHYRQSVLHGSFHHELYSGGNKASNLSHTKCPQFFSSSRIPRELGINPDKTKVRYVVVKENNRQIQNKLLPFDALASDLLSMLDNNDDNNNNTTIHVLRAPSSHEYLFGERRLTDYNYVRQCIIHGSFRAPVPLALVAMNPEDCLVEPQLFSFFAHEYQRNQHIAVMPSSRPSPPRPSPRASLSSSSPRSYASSISISMSRRSSISVSSPGMGHQPSSPKKRKSTESDVIYCNNEAFELESNASSSPRSVHRQAIFDRCQCEWNDNKRSSQKDVDVSSNLQAAMRECSNVQNHGNHDDEIPPFAIFFDRVEGWMVSREMSRVVCFVFHGRRCIPGLHWEISGNQSEWITFDSSIDITNAHLSVPREARMAFVVLNKDDKVIAWSAPPLLDCCGQLLACTRAEVAGELPQTTAVPLWLVRENEMEHATAFHEHDVLEFIFRFYGADLAADDAHEAAAVVLRVRKPRQRRHDQGRHRRSNSTLALSASAIPMSELSATLHSRVAQVLALEQAVRHHQHTNLPELSSEQLHRNAATLWKARLHLRNTSPESLPLLLRAVNWFDASMRSEVRHLLELWPKLGDASVALQLLDAQFAYAPVRLFAIESLMLQPIDVLEDLLPQLVQVLKFECHDNSPLTRFLVAYSISWPLHIGQALFYHLLVERENNPMFKARHEMLLEELLAHEPHFANELVKQHALIAELSAMDMENVRHHDFKLHSFLEHINRQVFRLHGPHVLLPHDARCAVTSLAVSKCRVMDSKQAPLWLECVNKHDSKSTIQVLYKQGDDLRQDILVLQLLRRMQTLWTSADLTLQLTPYRVTATHGGSQMSGFIEIVPNSTTTADILFRFGHGKRGALKKHPLHSFVLDCSGQGGGERKSKKMNNMMTSADAAYHEKIEMFTKSCAAYCVASHVLGLADRHASNMMLNDNCKFFHIDFGHFLGNWKRKLGFTRERTSFVFSRQMLHVITRGHSEHDGIGRALYQRFKSMCSQGFTVLRKHLAELDILLVVMLSAGIPELNDHTDIDYFRQQLIANHVSEQEASDLFDAAIDRAVHDRVRVLDNLAHLFKHN